MKRYRNSLTPRRMLAASVMVALFFTGEHGAAQDGLRGEGSHLPLRPGKAEYWDTVIGVADDPDARITGAWDEHIFRQSFPARRHLHTEEDGAAIERVFDTPGLVLVLETHRPYVYSGNLNNGLLEIAIDGEVTQVIQPLTEANEIVLYRGRAPEPRDVRVRHLDAPNGGRGARIIGFRQLDEPSADLAFFLTAEAGDLLVDARITVKDGGDILRSVVQRNWMSGMIRLAGLPPGEGYMLRIEALGWETVTLPLPPLHANSERLLTPIHLPLDAELLTQGFQRPRLGYPAVKRPGDELEVRFAPHEHGEYVDILELRWDQRVGKARRSVTLWEGPETAPAEGFRMTIALPDAPLDGMGDLVADVRGPQGVFTWRAPQGLHMRERFPEQPVFLVCGHLDTWGHYQGEYLAVLAELANLIEPDAVLISNEVHPAYTAGGFKKLHVPHLVNIGNHSFGYEESPSYLDADGARRPGPAFPLSLSLGQVEQGYAHREPHYAWRHAANRVFDRWYGDPMGVFEIGPDIAVLNYGWSWEPTYNQEAIDAARDLFAPYRNRRIRVLNAYESEPPREFLEHFGFALVHSAHAWPRARNMHADDPRQVRGHHFSIDDGAMTFIGKRTSDTFWVVRFADDRVASMTYAGHDTQPWPLDRHGVAPLRVQFDDDVAASGLHRARLINEYRESFDACRIDWVLPQGRYEVRGGTVHHSWNSDDGEWTVLTVRTGAPANEIHEIEAKQIE
ncbi:MAG: hypothetical protein EA424_03940 [Planctomycetaceae bacterium]|nr:MAG: hypothetical protein EA424_03940 [Planctomycetaceae bacterium]